MRFVSGKRFVQVLALTLAAAIVAGVAASAAKTAPPTPLTGSWERQDADLLFVRPRGKVEIREGGWYFARFKRVAAHRLGISGIRSCSGTGTYRWTITAKPIDGYVLKFTKIHDPCKRRVNLLTNDTWGRSYSHPPPLP